MVDFDQIMADISHFMAAVDPTWASLFFSWMAVLICLGGMVFIIRQLVILRKLYESRLAKLSHLIVALTKAMESREKSFDSTMATFVRSTAQIEELSEHLGQSSIFMNGALKRLEESLGDR